MAPMKARGHEFGRSVAAGRFEYFDMKPSRKIQKNLEARVRGTTKTAGSSPQVTEVKALIVQALDVLDGGLRAVPSEGSVS